nr:polyketide synthase [uncultured Flavobacterium sp.]
MEDKVAIIGLGCNFPGAENIQEFWENLCESKDSISSISEEQIIAEGIDLATIKKKNYIKAASVINNPYDFDASFFYLSKKEAEKMDPQLRTFLETSWTALEDAGYNSEKYKGNIGVFSSSLMSTYLLNNVYTSKENYDGDIDALISDISGRMGNDSNYLSTRTSFHLNLTGPSISVQTACSSSLVAVHLASQSILNGECDMALAGGVALRFPMNVGYLYEKDSILSSDGKCRAFDADASGTIFGNGCGVVILKRYEDAINDRDNILAIIKGSAMNNDGSDKIGYVSPSENGLTRVISEAVAVAQIDRNSISYIEAHGTGTIMGDTIELKALNNVFSGDIGRDVPFAIGSVKTNIGHLSVAAGIAGLIKTTLMLQNKKIPATLNFDSLNPNCEFENSPFYVNTKLKEWETENQVPRRAGVTSMGMGGTNVHIIMEEHLNTEISTSDVSNSSIIALSAKTPEALSKARINLAEFLETNTHINLADISYTNILGRRTFDYRLVTVADNLKQLKENLYSNSSTILYKDGHPSEKPFVFMFPGQGSQYENMGKDLYKSNPTFKKTYDFCLKIIDSNLGINLAEPLLNNQVIDHKDTKHIQLSLFVFEYSLAMVLIEIGIKPSALIGHSLGEYVAACISGVFSIEDVLKIISKRGELMEQISNGKMLAISSTYEVVKKIIGEKVDVAAVNEASVCVISGDDNSVNEIFEILQNEGIPSKYLNSSHAFHSKMMQPIVIDFVEYVRQFQLNAPTIPFVSNVSGDWINPNDAQNPQYWGDHIVSTVKFSKGIDVLLNDVDNIFIEVGPGSTLSNYVRRNPNKERGRVILSSIGKTLGGKFENIEFKNLLGRLWLEGINIKWETYFQWEGDKNRVSLPTYPFQRETYSVLRNNSYNNKKISQNVKLDMQDWLFTPSWKSKDNFSDKKKLVLDEPLLVFANDTQHSKNIIGFLQKNDFSNVYLVYHSDFLSVEQDVAFIRADQQNDYNVLIKNLKDSGRIPKHIIHTWLVGEKDDDKNEYNLFENVNHWHKMGSLSAVFLAKSLGFYNIVSQIKFDIISSDLYIILGSENDNPNKSTILPVSKVISQEYPHITCCILDIEYTNMNISNFELLIENIFSNNINSLAVRWPNIWKQDFQKYEEPIVNSQDVLNNIKQGGIYLVTGGIGDIGISISKMLSQKYNAKLIIVFRDKLPEKKEWERIISEGKEEKQIKHIQNILALEAINADFTLYNIDVSSLIQMKELVEKIEADKGNINGVIHCAGLPGEKWDRTIALTNEETFEWHYQSKVYGQLVLEQLFTDRNLDFVILMSSIASALGGLRLLPYACANSYMGYAASSINHIKQKNVWTAIHWDVWQHHQDEKRALSNIGKMMDDKTVLHDEGLAIIEHIMNNRFRPSQIIVSTWDLQLRLDQWVKYISSSEKLSVDIDYSHISTSENNGDNEIMFFVMELFTKILGNVEISDDADFFELGGDSLISVSLLSKVRDRFEIDISLANFLDNPTPSILVKMIKEKILYKDIDQQILEFSKYFDNNEISALIEQLS